MPGPDPSSQPTGAFGAYPRGSQPPPPGMPVGAPIGSSPYPNHSYAQGNWTLQAGPQPVPFGRMPSAQSQGGAAALVIAGVSLLLLIALPFFRVVMYPVAHASFVPVLSILVCFGAIWAGRAGKPAATIVFGVLLALTCVWWLLYQPVRELAIGLYSGGFYIWIPTIVVMATILIPALVTIAIGVTYLGRRPQQGYSTPVAPIGYTAEGNPVFPVVGHTPDGRAVTADQIVGGGMVNPRTNSLAIAALVLGLVFPLAAIPVGHVSRAQIRRTGEQGAGLALAGLVFGYLGLLSLVALIVMFVYGLNL